MVKALVLFTLLASITAQAEYRVFMLLLSNTKAASAKQIQTTLDPDQYRTLFPLNEGESLTYVDTWMCTGRTDFFKTHCEKPEKVQPPAASLDRSPASTTSQSPDIKN